VRTLDDRTAVVDYGFGVAERPVIGYTIYFRDPHIDAVDRGLREPLQRLGALPLLLSRSTPVDDVGALLDLLDGVEVSGGYDVDPSWYGEQPHASTEPADAAHDAFELELVRQALDRGMPVLGICRGSQVLAVADGGRLTQDVATLHDGAGPHENDWVELALEPPGGHWHDVTVEPGSAAERWFRGGPRQVNSFHHQCVAEPGRRLRATVRALDGVIEAVERDDRLGWAAGLQWHNELQWHHDPRFLRPFEDLVEAARAYRERRP
jgi:putative glutamine amidotransferase